MFDWLYLSVLITGLIDFILSDKDSSLTLTWAFSKDR